jgi:site-specific DNA-methyltransferase (adenine-specific)
MKTFLDNHFSAIVTDPPYGLSFMNKGWDYEVPGIEYWKEAYRVLKPGGSLLAMGGTRTFHRQICAIEDAGFEIRDCIMWIYGSGFPKSHNHFGIEGYGTALKPAYEPITLAMKPLDGTFAQNAEKWGQAGINIDGCRIGTEENLGRVTSQDTLYEGGWKKINVPNPKGGRWPANVILDEEASQQLGPPSRFFYCAKTSSRERNAGLEGLPEIQCQTGCSGDMPTDDQGKERDRFKKVARNHHPTVKPLALMKYLITLVSPPTNALILDPFAGSGSTILAAKQLGISALGIEKQPEYCEIAKARLNCVEEETQMDLFQSQI